MVSAATLDIDIGVKLGASIGKLESLAESLRDVAAAQRLVDEEMSIDVDVDDDALGGLESRLKEGFSLAARDPKGRVSTLEDALVDVDGDPITDGGVDMGEGPITDGGIDTPLLDNLNSETRRNILGITGPLNRADFVGGEDGVEKTGLPTVRDDDLLPQVATEQTTPLALRQRGISDGEQVDRFNPLNFDDTDFGFGGMQGVNFVDTLKEGVDDLGETFNDANDAFDELNISMTTVNDLLADFVPLLGALIGTVPALAASFASLAALGGGLAGGLGAVAGLGLFGITEMRKGPAQKNISAIFDSIKQQFTEAFAPIARTFAPTVLKAIDDFKRFIDTLAQSSTALLSLRDEFDALIDFALPRTATFLRRMARAGEAAAPVFANVAAFLQQTNFARGFAKTLADTLPLLRDVATIIVGAIPPLIRFSLGVGAAVIALTKMFGVIASLGGIIPSSAKGLGLLVGTLLVFITAISLTSSFVNALSFILSSQLVKAIATAITSFTTIQSTILATALGILGAAAITATALALVTAGVSALVSAIGTTVSASSVGEQSLRNFAETGGRGRRGGEQSRAPNFVETGDDVTYNDVTTYNIDATSVEKGKRVGRSLSYREGKRTDNFVVPR